MTKDDALRMMLGPFKAWRDVPGNEDVVEELTKIINAVEKVLAQPEPIQSLQCFHCQVTIETLNDKVMQLMAQRTEQEPPQRKPLTDKQIEQIQGMANPNRGSVGVQEARPPAQRTEQNFCPRCGKRTTDLTTIHTCTPPKENT
jgi:hypothetical protein